MQHKKTGWKRPAILLLILLLLFQMGDLAYLRYFDARRHLPVLMYHHFDEECPDGTVVTPERFREQMTALRDAGYQAVTIRQVRDYVERGGTLPDKPVLITMDDGYTSNLTVAAPILEELGLCATVFVIGVYEGETRNVNNGWKISIPRFAYQEALPWVEKGVLDLQSHSFNMHLLIADGFGSRDGMLPMDGESGDDFRRAVLNDAEQARLRREEDGVPGELCALAFPFGYYNQELDGVLAEAGYAVTFTIDERINRLTPGDPACLRMLGRINVTDQTSGEKLVKRVQRYS